ncbi:MAG: protein kinase [Ruminococcus sp.]|nr:protein kinase [Ruminococcus sp.]
MKSLASAFMKLAEHGVVHADVKPNNLIFKDTVDGFFTAKIIDFDVCFLEDHQLYLDEIMGDTVYYAPETILRINEEEVDITSKADVFALGILFHQIVCGTLPGINDPNSHSVAEAVLNDVPLQLENTPYRDLIANMLLFDVEKRLSSKEVFQRLKRMGSAKNALPPVKGVSMPSTDNEGDGPRWHPLTDFDN